MFAAAAMPALLVLFLLRVLKLEDRSVRVILQECRFHGRLDGESLSTSPALSSKFRSLGGMI